MTDLIDRKVDEPIDRLHDGLLGYAIERLKQDHGLVACMENVKFLNRGEVSFL